MKEGLLGGDAQRVTEERARGGPCSCCTLDCRSRRKIDVCLISEAAEVVDEWASPPDADRLRGLARRVGMHAPSARGLIESMNGARFVHDTLEELGWEVLIADAHAQEPVVPPEVASPAAQHQVAFGGSQLEQTFDLGDSSLDEPLGVV
jgi:hypothetical protein